MLQVGFQVVGCWPGNHCTFPFKVAQGAVHQARHATHPQIMGQLYSGMDCGVGRNSVQFQQLVSSKPQEQQGVFLQLLQWLSRKLGQGKIDPAA